MQPFISPVNTHTSTIQTERCEIIPFSLSEERVHIEELWREFLKINQTRKVSDLLPTKKQEIDYIWWAILSMKNGQIFENFILEKETGKFIGCIGLNTPEKERMNIGLWIREDMQGKWFGTEAYKALLLWAKENTRYNFLKHSLLPGNKESEKLAHKFWWILQEEKTERGFIIYHIPLS